MRNLSLLALVFVCGGVAGWKLSDLRRFWDDDAETRIRVQNTAWNAEVRSGRHSMQFVYGFYTGTDIRLVNESSGAEIELVEGADVLKDSISSDAPNELKITLSNLTVAKLHMVSVPDVNIVWNFTPRDDPDIRQKHRRWEMEDKTSEASRAWFCANMVPENLAGRDLQEWDRAIAGEAYGWGSGRTRYCLDGDVMPAP